MKSQQKYQQQKFHQQKPGQQKAAAPSRLHTRPREVARSGDLNEQQVINAIRRHNQMPFPILNRAERRQVQQHMMEELAQGFEHRRQALGMALQTRLHSIQEACNHVLVTGKTHLRQQRLEYFGQVFRQVEQRMNSLADDFLGDMDSRFERLESFKSEAIRQREKQRLEKSVGDFLDTLDQLMDEFRSIISENITYGEAGGNTAPPPGPEPQYEDDEDVIEYEETLEFGVTDVVDQFMDADLEKRNDWSK